MNDIYQRIQVAGEKQDSKQILAVLAGIREGRLENDLKLVNYYRQVPVSYLAEVLTVEEDAAELSVHAVQAVVISMEKLTVLRSRHFSRDVVGHVAYVNVAKSRIVVTGLSYALVRADRRMSVRVELSDPIEATFRAEGITANGTLCDMSLTGISITLPGDPGLSLSQAGELTVALPDDTINLPASLLAVKPAGTGCRLIFEIELNRGTEKSISRYIFKRQVEIIKELKDHPDLGR